MKFRLGTCFQTYVEFFPMANNLFNNRPHLIHFYRIDYEILGFITIFLGSRFKTIRDAYDTIIENIGKPHQYR